MLPAPTSQAKTRWLLRAVATPIPEKVTQAARAVVRFAEVQQKLGLRTSVVRTRMGSTTFVTNRAHASLGAGEVVGSLG